MQLFVWRKSILIRFYMFAVAFSITQRCYEQIALKVYSEKFRFMTHIFFNTIFIYINVEVIKNNKILLIIFTNSVVSDPITFLAASTGVVVKLSKL